jgi:hypothetical protein
MQITFKPPPNSLVYPGIPYIGRALWWVEIMMTAVPARRHDDIVCPDDLDNLAASLAASLDHLTRCFCEPDVADEDVNDAAIAA